MRLITAIIEKDRETGWYVGIIPGLPAAHSQGETLDELYANLKEVAELCIEEMTDYEKEIIPDIVGIYRFEVEV